MMTNSVANLISFFAFQVAEQAKFLNKTVVHIAVGIPSRITQLLENGKQLYLLSKVTRDGYVDEVVR